MAQTRKPIQLRDPDGTARRLASRIAKRHNLSGGVSAAIGYSLNFTDSAERIEKPPLDYSTIDIPQLRVLVAYGYDHYTRAAALSEIERRYRMQEATS